MDHIAHKQRKKRLLKIVCIVMGIIIFLALVSYGISWYLQKRASQEPVYDFNFYPADYSENIFENAEYMALISNKFIEYTDASMNLTLGITRDNAIDYGADVDFMVEYIYTVQAGEVAKYNGFFSEEYYKNNSKKESFTMQKLYDVNITKVSAETAYDESGRMYTKYKYKVEYSIFQNNGTFRNDFNTGRKAQYIFFTNKSGEFLIDSVSTPQVKR
ncbi:MAG: hypothetical protein J6V42_05280 [Clostridia bacterium]|nr:hypothetical protein [Clostridia bacterium]